MANTHLMFKIKRTHLKLGQLLVILRTLQKLKQKLKPTQTFLCGDFNFIPNSALYHYLSRGQINLGAGLSQFSNQNKGYIKSLKGGECSLRNLNLKYSYKKGKYRDGTFKAPKCSSMMAENEGFSNSEEVCNFKCFEDLATLVPLVDVFPDEIVFCNVESLSRSALQSVFTKKYVDVQFDHFFQNMDDPENLEKRRGALAELINRLSDSFIFESAYSYVKSRVKQCVKGDDQLCNDVMVTQYGDDVKGIRYIYKFIATLILVILILENRVT